MTRKEYDIYVNTLPTDGQNAFRYKGIRYFINHDIEGWILYKVEEIKKGEISSRDKFNKIKVYSNVNELVSDKIFEGKSLNEIFMDIEYAEF